MNSSGTLPEQLAEHVLERDHADHLLRRVHDERLVAAALAQKAEQPIGRHRVGDPQDRSDEARERAGTAALEEVGHDVLGVQDAGDVGDRAAIDRAAGCTGSVATIRRTSLIGVRDLDRGQAITRHHELARVAQPETQRAVEPHLLLRLEQAAVAALRDQQADLFRRVHVTVRRRRHPQQPAQEVRAAIEEGDEPRVEPGGPEHRARGEKRRLRRNRSATVFGTISPNTTETIVSEMRTVALASDSAVSWLSEDQPLDERRHARRDDGFGVGAERHARQRDADLGGGDVAREPLGILDDRQQLRGRRVSVLAQAPQPAPADADRSELGGHVERGQPDEQQDDSCGEEHRTILLGSIEACRRARPRLGQRDMDGERGATAGFAADLDEAARLPDDAVDAREPQPGALAHVLGGEIRLENLVQGHGDAQAGVGDGQHGKRPRCHVRLARYPLLNDR